MPWSALSVSLPCAYIHSVSYGMQLSFWMRSVHCTYTQNAKRSDSNTAAVSLHYFPDLHQPSVYMLPFVHTFKAQITCCCCDMPCNMLTQSSVSSSPVLSTRFSMLMEVWVLQDQGTAIWLFAYFGYWVEIFIVIAFKILSGTLLVAGVKKKQLRKPVLPKTADQVSTSPEDSSKVVSIPKGKEVQPSDFIVGHDTVQHQGKGKDMFEEKAEGSGSSGSSGSSSNPQQQHVEMAAMQVRQ